MPALTTLLRPTLLTGPFQMEIDGDIAATFGGRRDECPKTSGQDPKCSRNDACKQCKHRSKRYEIKQNRHRFAAGS